MPIIRSAKKKLRQDIKREHINYKVKEAVKRAIKNFKKSPSLKSFSKTASLIDTAAKKNIFHKNKSNRLKSKLSKFLKNPEKKPKKQPVSSK